jgi:hypothetical protein
LYKETTHSIGFAEEYLAVNRTLAIVIGLCMSLLIAACTNEPNTDVDKDERHVWSDQTDAIERAREVENTVLKAAEQQRQAIEAMED